MQWPKNIDTYIEQARIQHERLFQDVGLNQECLGQGITKENSGEMQLFGNLCLQKTGHFVH